MKEQGRNLAPSFSLLSTSYKPRPVKVARLYPRGMGADAPVEVRLGICSTGVIGSISAFQADGTGSRPVCCSRAIERGMAAADNRKDGVDKTIIAECDLCRSAHTLRKGFRSDEGKQRAERHPPHG